MSLSPTLDMMYPERAPTEEEKQSMLSQIMGMDRSKTLPTFSLKNGTSSKNEKNTGGITDLSSPEQQDPARATAAFLENLSSSFKKQDAAIDEQKARIKAWSDNQKPEINYAPLFGAIDTLTNGKSHLAEQYKGHEPMSEQQKQLAVLELNDKVIGRQGQLSTVDKGLLSFMFPKFPVEKATTGATGEVKVATVPEPVSSGADKEAQRLEGERKTFLKETKYFPQIIEALKGSKELLPTIPDNVPIGKQVWSGVKKGLSEWTGVDTILTPEEAAMKQVQQRLAGITNYLITGAASTDKEFARAREILGNMNYSSKEALIRGYNELVSELHHAMQNIETNVPLAAADNRGKPGEISSDAFESMRILPGQGIFKKPAPPAPPAAEWHPPMVANPATGASGKFVPKSMEEIGRMTPEQRAAYINALKGIVGGH